MTIDEEGSLASSLSEGEQQDFHKRLMKRILEDMYTEQLLRVMQTVSDEVPEEEFSEMSHAVRDMLEDKFPEAKSIAVFLTLQTMAMHALANFAIPADMREEYEAVHPEALLYPPDVCVDLKTGEHFDPDDIDKKIKRQRKGKPDA